MNAAEVIRRLEESPREIRVLCPKGDFIANITLSVREGQLAMRWGLTGKDLRRRASQQGRILSADVHVADDGNVMLPCTRGKCRYRGYFNGQVLALDLARAALAGHAEYPLIS